MRAICRDLFKLPNRKKLAFALLTVVGLPMLLAACGELGLRLYIHHRYGMPGKSLGITQLDPEFGWVFRPDSYTINTVFNHQGFRGAEDVVQPKPAGSLRIYCSGNSSTYCTNLTVEQSWPNVLQRKLRGIPGHERDQVLNAGRPGASVACEFALARRDVPRFKPDVVIIHTGINEEFATQRLISLHGDNPDLLLQQGRFGIFPRDVPDRFLFRHSVLMRVLRDKTKQWLEPWTTSAFRGAPVAIHPWTLANFDQVLPDYIAYLKSQGSRVIFVRFGDTGVKSHYLDLMRTFRERGTRLAREAGATVCDVVPRFEGHPHRTELAASWSGVHVTARGAEVLADALLETLVGETHRTAAK